MEDHQLKSLIYRLEKTESKPKISVCPENKNNIVRVCVNPKCKTEENALICGTIECQCEKKNHSSCKIFLNYAYFKSIIREYNEKIKKVYNPIFASLKSIIEELTKLHNKLQQQMITFMMPSQFSQPIKQVNLRGNLKKQKAIKLSNLLQKYPKFSVKINEGTIKNYETDLKQKIKKMKGQNESLGLQIQELLLNYQNQFKRQIRQNNDLKVRDQKQIENQMQLYEGV